MSGESDIFQKDVVIPRHGSIVLGVLGRSGKYKGSGPLGEEGVIFRVAGEVLGIEIHMQHGFPT